MWHCRCTPRSPAMSPSRGTSKRTTPLRKEGSSTKRRRRSRATRRARGRARPRSPGSSSGSRSCRHRLWSWVAQPGEAAGPRGDRPVAQLLARPAIAQRALARGEPEPEARQRRRAAQREPAERRVAGGHRHARGGRAARARAARRPGCAAARRRTRGTRRACRPWRTRRRPDARARRPAAARGPCCRCAWSRCRWQPPPIQASRPCRASATRRGSTLVSPRPHTKRGRTTMVSNPRAGRPGRPTPRAPWSSCTAPGSRRPAGRSRRRGAGPGRAGWRPPSHVHEPPHAGAATGVEHRPVPSTLMRRNSATGPIPPPWPRRGRRPRRRPRRRSAPRRRPGRRAPARRQRLHPRRRGGRPRQGAHGPAVRREALDQGAADEAGAAGDEGGGHGAEPTAGAREGGRARAGAPADPAGGARRRAAAASQSGE